MAWQQPEHGAGEHAGDEEHGVADEHLGQGDLLWRHPSAGRRLSPPRCSLLQFYRRYDRRYQHQHNHYPGHDRTVHEGVQVVDGLLVVQVELARHEWHEGVLADRVVHTPDPISRGNEKIKSHDDEVDDDDDGGGGGGTQHGLGAERLQDAEASLAGDDGGQDLGNTGKGEETREVVVCQVAREWTVPGIMIKQIVKACLSKNPGISTTCSDGYADRQNNGQQTDFMSPRFLQYFRNRRKVSACCTHGFTNSSL